ncbi:MAG: hypothetical protein JWN94_1507 [Betaproteobacteria bacterium]|nr:hypothetical protein [Betaproteobacteria bacterium]
MEQIIVGVFDNQNQAQRARQELLSAGFSSGEVTIKAQDSSTATTDVVRDRDTDREEGGIAHLFRSLFGMEEHHRSADLYAEAVHRGHCVVTVNSRDSAQLDRAQEILEQCGAIDVDERSSEWGMERDSTGDASAAGVTASAAAQPGSVTDKAIPVVEEELRVGKREVRRGGVRVFARMSETPAQKTVQLREEHAKVERRPVDRPATEADFVAFKDGTIEVRETAEEAVVDKRARVVEEVRVSKETTQREETVRDSVRQTDVQVDRIEDDETDRDRVSAATTGLDAADYDDDFRAHWKSTYGDTGGNYEDHRPAYSYGSTLGNDDRYKGRAWDDIETDARRDWESRYPDSTWERFKASVRHGWETIAGGTQARPRASRRGAASRQPRA